MRRKIVLMGNPNVGKSVVFSHLTGVQVVVANYPGTTVDFSLGPMKIGEETVDLIDAPGTYSIYNDSPAERVASDVMKEADVVVNVVDATNLERNLYLTCELLDEGIPMIVVANLTDEAERKGITIDFEQLAERLGVPVVPAVALAGRGMKELVSSIADARPGQCERRTADARWQEVGRIVTAVQSIVHRHQTIGERIQDACLRPLIGLPVAGLIVAVACGFVITVGQFMEELLKLLVFGSWYGDLMMWLSGLMGGSGFAHDLLIGRMFDGELCFEESFGVLTTGVFVEFGIVLPFLVAFYFVLGLLEDLGFMPRLAVLMDKFMHRLGLHGYAIVPMVLGFGCNVPATMSARNLESRRERFITCTLVSIAIPCMAQLALIVGLVGQHGMGYLAVVFATLFSLWVILGLLIDRFTTGFTPSMILEIPPLRVPTAKALGKKMWMRTTGFLIHATPWILGGIAFINSLYLLGVIDLMAKLFAPVITGLMGLPDSAISSILVGFLRKDVAVAMLEPLGLTAVQLVVGCTVLAVYFPCAATFTVLARELGPRDMARAAVIMLGTAVLTGTMLNLFTGWMAPWVLAAAIMVVTLVVASIMGGASERRELNVTVDGE